MIDLYTWSTPNGRKVSIALEELGLPYTVYAVDITADEQYQPRFTAISPNQKIPAIVDHDNGMRMMESGAILLYLAEKAGRLLPESEGLYWETIEWLMWQKASLGPMLGQAHHFLKFNRGKSNYAEGRYLKEAQRLYRVLNERLECQAYVVDDQLTIADIAAWPWVSRFEYQSIDLRDYPNVLEWYLRLARRPSVQAGYSVPLPTLVPMPARDQAG